MNVFLFILYFLALLFVIYVLQKKIGGGLNSFTVSSIYGYKVLLGCLYGLVFFHAYGGDDTWIFFRDSVSEYHKMIHDPRNFFYDFSPANEFSGTKSLFSSFRLYLYDLEYWTMRKLLAFFNIFSRGNYYIDVLFFDFLVFWGPFLLYRLTTGFYPLKKRILVAVIFFLPGPTFWLSGIRGDGLLFGFFCLTIYFTSTWLRGAKLKYLLPIVLGIGGMLVFRSAFLLILFPAFLAWLVAVMNPARSIHVFAAIYTIAAILFFLSPLIPKTQGGLPQVVADRQLDFYKLPGKTVFGLDTLRPTLGGFVRLAPEAAANGFFRPLPWETHGILQMFSSFDCLIFIVFLMLPWVFPGQHWVKSLTSPLSLFYIAFGTSLILFIGYVVPFPGAIVRYKAIPEMLLIATCVIASRKPFKL